MKQLFLIAYRNILSHGKRSVMLGTAIAAVTTLLVFLSCLSSGVKATMMESATTVSTGHLNVIGYYKITAGQSAPLITDYQKVEEIVRKAIPDLDYVSDRGKGFARLVSDEASVQVGLSGVDLSQERNLSKVLKMKEGKLEDLAKPGSILLFESEAKKFNVKTGDSMTLSVLTNRGVNNTVDVKVCGIAEDMGMLTSWSAFVPKAVVSQLYQTNETATGSIYIYLKDLKNIPRDMDLLRKAMESAGYVVRDREANKPFWAKFDEINREDWTGQKFEITTWEDEISYFSWSIAVINGLSFLLTAVLLIIISVGIMNTLWIAIRERTREIGTLRAIGMGRSGVLTMFVLEAFGLGVMGTLAGVLIGSFLALVLNAVHVPVPEGARMFIMSTTLRFALDAGRIFGGAAVITLCCTVVSLIPSYMAAKLKPVTAMSHVG